MAIGLLIKYVFLWLMEIKMTKNIPKSVDEKLSTLVHNFRGEIEFDLPVIRDLVLVTFFLKAVSVDRSLVNVPANWTFDSLCAADEGACYGEIKKIIHELEEINETALSGLGDSIENFASGQFSGPILDKFTFSLCRNLCNLNLEEYLNEDPRVFAKSFLWLVDFFAVNSGKRAGEFSSPPAVSDLIIRLVEPKEGMSIYDPVCGSGGFFIKAANFIENNGGKSNLCSFFGQDINLGNVTVARLNLAIHGLASSEVYAGDSIAEPFNISADGRVDEFDIVIADPPFSVKSWISPSIFPERDDRFEFGVPPKSSADYAFILHILYSVKKDGKAAVIVPDGVLFRGGTEGKIRQRLIEESYVDAVVSLPPKLFIGTGIAANILVLNKNSPFEDVLFIDLDEGYSASKLGNSLSQSYIELVDRIYKSRDFCEGNSCRASFNEIAENNFDLRASRYVKKEDSTDEVSLSEVINNQCRLEKELAQLQNEMHQLLSEFGIS